MTRAEAAVSVLRGAAVLLGAAGAGLFLWIVAHRIAYPYDLEWIEGGMLCHALRLLHGQPIYTAPSVDFIPHLYTPLYSALVAGIGRLTGDVGYLSARLLSLLSFLLALGAGGFLAWRAGGSMVAAAVAMALPLLSFPQVGGFYDLARGDSLQLGLLTCGAALCWEGRGRHRHMALAAALLVAAFFAKQTAAPMIASCGAALLCTRRRTVATLALCGGLLFVVVCYALDRSSGGWFWTYIFRLHQGHAFYTRRAFVETPLLLGKTLGVGLALVPLALYSRRTRAPGLLYVSWLGLGGVVSSCIAFGTQWAHANAYIPGIFFPSVAIGAAAGRLLGAAGGGGLVRQGAVWALLCASLAPRLYLPGPHIPTAADRAAGDAVIARLRQASGEVLIPFHPFYAHLAGKRTYLHRMGVWDVRGTVAGEVRGLSAALRQRRFSRIIFDYKVEWTWGDWPGVLESYRIVERFRGPRVVEGAETAPSLVMEPIPDPPAPGPPIDRELQ